MAFAVFRDPASQAHADVERTVYLPRDNVVREPWSTCTRCNLE